MVWGMHRDDLAAATQHDFSCRCSIPLGLPATVSKLLPRVQQAVRGSPVHAYVAYRDAAAWRAARVHPCLDYIPFALCLDAAAPHVGSWAEEERKPHHFALLCSTCSSFVRICV